MNNTGKRFKRVRVRRTTSPGIILGDGVINSAPPRALPARIGAAVRWKAADTSWGYTAYAMLLCGRLNASCYIVMLHCNNAGIIYWFTWARGGSCRGIAYSLPLLEGRNIRLIFYLTPNHVSPSTLVSSSIDTTSRCTTYKCFLQAADKSESNFINNIYTFVKKIIHARRKTIFLIW